MRTEDLHTMSDQEFKAAARNDCQVATFASTIYDYLLEALRRWEETERRLEIERQGGRRSR